MTWMVYKLWDMGDEDGACRIGATVDLRRMMQVHFRGLRRCGDERTTAELILAHRLLITAHAETRVQAEQAKREVTAHATQKGEVIYPPVPRRR